MQEVLIFGHKKPDTDSVTSAIALAELKKALGIKATPYVLGDINNETKFALNYFKIKEPKYLNDVKLQIKDLNYEKDIEKKDTTSIYDCYNYMNEINISTLPIVNNNGKFVGAVSMKDIAKYLVEKEEEKLHTSYKNIIETLVGEEILKYDDDIEGNIIFASFKSTTFIETINLNESSILIVGDRHSIIEYAVNKKVKLLIITGNGNIKPEHIEIAKKNHVNIIRTKYLSYKVTRLIPLTNYVDIVTNENIITVNENDYVDDLINIINKTKRSNYPVVDRNNICLGIVKHSNLHEKNRKKVILIDHNEKEQSIDSLCEADIVEIIDHHKIGSINTQYPISIRNVPVGSSNTIVYKMYQENNVKINKNIAGIMLAGILSDTLLFKSPTTTEEDIDAAKELAKLSNVNYKVFASEMFDAGSSIVGKTVEEIIFGDFKNFTINDKRIGISQLSTTNAKEILNNINSYVDAINKLSKINDYQVLALFVTDIINEGSYIIYSDNSKQILEESFNVSKLEQGHYFDAIISRKKQIIPNIMEYLEKK